jgi:hypothetical protein
VSGAALAAGVHGFDRWKAGPGGATLTFTASPPSTVVTITAGTLQQVVEGASVVGGNYMLSWTGAAQGRVGAGAYAASPVAITGITAGANTTIEFNAGTVSRVKFESGAVATPWVNKAARDEVSTCQRFYQSAVLYMAVNVPGAGSSVGVSTTLAVPMRGTPILAAGVNSSVNLTGIVLSTVGGTFGTVNGVGTVTTGGVQTVLNMTLTASADL